IVGTFRSDMPKSFTLKAPYTFVLVKIIIVFDLTLRLDVGHIVWDICPPSCLKFVQGFVELLANEGYGF
ncbi:hypothetical protein A2U01_0071892, partial [Trifolium medium]|nr:hypothetical protein [Trifolium medium]